MTRQGLFGCDTGPGEYSGSAGGFEQGCPTGGHGTGTVGDRHVRATILQTVAPSDALDCIGHGLATHTDSPGLQARHKCGPQRKDAFAQQPLRGVSASGCRTRAAGLEFVVHPLATPETPGAFYKGYRLMGIDGTVMDVPDSPANEERFGRGRGGRGDAAFPQIRKLSLVELGTHAETVLAIGGYHDSEQKLVVQLFDKIPDDALLLEDRNFFSYDTGKSWILVV